MQCFPIILFQSKIFRTYKSFSFFGRYIFVRSFQRGGILASFILLRILLFLLWPFRQKDRWWGRGEEHLQWKEAEILEKKSQHQCKVVANLCTWSQWLEKYHSNQFSMVNQLSWVPEKKDAQNTWKVLGRQEKKSLATSASIIQMVLRSGTNWGWTTDGIDDHFCLNGGQSFPGPICLAGFVSILAWLYALNAHFSERANCRIFQGIVSKIRIGRDDLLNVKRKVIWCTCHLVLWWMKRQNKITTSVPKKFSTWNWRYKKKEYASEVLQT